MGLAIRGWRDRSGPRRKRRWRSSRWASGTTADDAGRPPGAPAMSGSVLSLAVGRRALYGEHRPFPAGGFMPISPFWSRAAAVVLPVALTSVAAATSAGSGDAPVTAARVQTTRLISHSFRGGVPNGPSTHGVISGDRRYARLIAFQSTASNVVRGDTNH